MKTLLVSLTLATLSFSAFAAYPTTRCLAQAQDIVQNLELPTDDPLRIESTEKGVLLKAGETTTIFGTTVGPYNTTKIFYQFAGSIQSGYFSSALVLEADTCSFTETVELYSE